MGQLLAQSGLPGAMAILGQMSISPPSPKPSGTGHATRDVSLRLCRKAKEGLVCSACSASCLLHLAPWGDCWRAQRGPLPWVEMFHPRRGGMRPAEAIAPSFARARGPWLEQGREVARLNPVKIARSRGGIQSRSQGREVESSRGREVEASQGREVARWTPVKVARSRGGIQRRSRGREVEACLGREVAKWKPVKVAR